MTTTTRSAPAADNERLLRRGQDGLRIYRRRVLILLGIGLVHSFSSARIKSPN